MDLLLAEKPSSAKAIARALGNSQQKRFNKKVPYYIVDNDKYVCSAVGHLFTLYPRDSERGHYPKWDYMWVPTYSANPRVSYAKGYLDCLKAITSQFNFDRYIIATDFDPEGTVIGFITFISLKIPMEKAYRMKMHSLAKDEVLRAYNNLEPPDYPWFRAGLARHQTDILYGINLTEIFSDAITKVRGRRKTVSLGRVQTPTLKFVVDREREIRSFVPKPYWNVLLKFEFQGLEYEAKHVLGDIFDKNVVQQILEHCKGATNTKITKVEKTIVETHAPTLFNLPMLQQEAFYRLGFSPDYVDRLAQSLYQQALITYPRTGSTAIWTGVPYKKVLDNLEKETTYAEYVHEIKENNFQPHKRGISDGAHVALSPTGEPYTPKTSNEVKLLDLIKRRFLAVFFPPLKREKTEITLDVNSEDFKIVGEKTIDLGWLKPYTYRKITDFILPDLQEESVISIKAVDVSEKQTSPPPRYTSASLVRKMEEENIGTKATRAEIVKLLWRRGYLYYEKNSGLRPTNLGEKLIEVSEKFCPLIIDVKLTSELENDLESIMDNKVSREVVVNKAKENINKILNDVGKNLLWVGKELATEL
jgi:DNA topoisomerase-1